MRIFNVFILKEVVGYTHCVFSTVIRRYLLRGLNRFVRINVFDLFYSFPWESRGTRASNGRKQSTTINHTCLICLYYHLRTQIVSRKWTGLTRLPESYLDANSACHDRFDKRLACRGRSLTPSFKRISAAAPPIYIEG